MLRFRQIVPVLIISLLISLQGVAYAAEDKSDATVKAPPEKQDSGAEQLAVAEWFENYDQIRRDAEMTLSDKLQSMRLIALRPGEKNIALASRMKKKYAAALSQMQHLTPVPETAELQEGYIQYFTKAEQLTSNYIETQEKPSNARESILSLKKQIEELDNNNKLLDEKLRAQYSIKRHKHI